MPILHRLAGFFGAFCTTMLLALSPAAADTLIDNVNGISVARNGSITRFTGMVIGADGRITQILQRKDKRPRKTDYEIDGKGRTLIPGIVDSHAELMEIGLAALAAEDAHSPSGIGRPPPRPEDLDVAFQKAQRLLAARGITTVADMGTTIEDWQAYRRAGDAGTLYIRIAAYANDLPTMVLIGGPGPTPWLYEDRLRLNGGHLALDGDIAGRRAALKSPYADDPDTQGFLRHGDAQLRNMMSRAAIDGFQLAVTAHGDAAQAEILSAIDELSPTYKGERRWRFEGVQLVDRADLPRFVQSGVIAGFTPSQLASDAALATARLGPVRAAMVQPWQTVDQAKITLVFGSGSGHSLPTPFADLAAMITRANMADQTATGWQPQQVIGRETALAAVTANAAFAAYADGHFGQLVAGERADFLILDRDPLTVTPTELRATNVLETWIGGLKIHEEGIEIRQQYGKEMPGW